MADVLHTFQIHIKGETALLMHADDIEHADRMAAWKANAANKKTSKAGDDRSPAWRWLGAIYKDDGFVVIPSDNLMRCLMEGGAMVPVPGAKGNKTFKAQTQSGIIPTGYSFPLLIGGKPVLVGPLAALEGEANFDHHKAAAARAGFTLFLKRAKIGQSKHVRVRPRFDEWQLMAEVMVTDEQITAAVLQEIVTYAGRYKGLGDWRPGGKTPGPFGMFKGTVTQLS